MKKDKDKVKLFLWVTKDQRKAIKRLALEHDMSMKKYILWRCLENESQK